LDEINLHLIFLAETRKLPSPSQKATLILAGFYLPLTRMKRTCISFSNDRFQKNIPEPIRNLFAKSQLIRRASVDKIFSSGRAGRIRKTLICKLRKYFLSQIFTRDRNAAFQVVQVVAQKRMKTVESFWREMLES